MKKIITLVLFSVIALCFVNAQNINSIQPEVITYKTIDTISLEMYVYRPENFSKDKKYKAIVFFHGGGWNSGSPQAFRRQSIYFASRGLICITPEYRIKNVHESTPFESVTDARSAMRYIVEHAEELNIDPEWIAAGGGSAGGHLASLLGCIENFDEPGENTKVSVKPKALLLYNPVVSTGPGSAAFERLKEKQQEISPMHNIKKNLPPTIMFFGTEDHIIPVKMAKEYKKKMKKAGNRCDLFLYKGQKHSFFNRSPYFEETLYESDIFLESLNFIEGLPAIKKKDLNPE